jgi:hypothetical protein
MAFWSAQINQDTGLPFKSLEEFSAKAQSVSKKHSTTIDYFAEQLEGYLPRLNRKKVKAKLAEYIAAYGEPPKDANELKRWGRNFAGSINRFRIDEIRAAAIDRGENPDDPQVLTRINQEINGDTWDTKTQNNTLEGAWEAFGDAEAHTQLQGNVVSGDLQSIEDSAPGSITEGDSGKPEQDPTERLKQFYDAIYNPQTASRIGQMAGVQGRRAQRGAGIRGGLADASVAQQTANAQLGYDQNVNAQALQYMGMENQKEIGLAQLAQQNAQFNAQQRALAAQNAYAQRGQTGGVIGGIAGGIVGGLIQGYTGAPVAGAFTAAGTGIGSMAGAGNAPGAYTVRSSSSLAKNSSSGKKSDGDSY